MHIKFISNNLLFYRNLDIIIKMNTFTIWLVLVIGWNYGYPKASPLEDVIVAIILSIFTSVLKKYFKI